MKIIDYSFIMDDSADNVRRRMKDKLKQGWQPIGGMIYNGRNYVQTIVMYEEIK